MDSPTNPKIPSSIASAEWIGWSAVDRATLCFVVEPERILLIRKKRGLGAGKINGPGGKQDPGESLVRCAVRETHEELGIEPLDVEALGRLRFQFLDGYSIDVTVFRTETYRGTPVETEEAEPLWAALDAVPFAEMWQDDELWFPYLLSGQHFEGRFLFDGDRMVAHHLEPVVASRVDPSTREDAAP